MTVYGAHNPTYPYEIRPEMKEAIDNYVKDGVPLGDFLTALLANDLMRALGRADEGNKRDIFDLCMYVHNEMPGGLHGSYEIIRDHIEAKKEEREGANGNT
jgi:hypothetical protein